MSAKKSSRKRGGFLWGAVAGAIAALLLAPRSGKETRAQVFGARDNLGGQTERLKGALDAGKGKAADQSEVLKRKIEETRARLRQQMDTLSDQTSEDEAGEVLGDPPAPT